MRTFRSGADFAAFLQRQLLTVHIEIAGGLREGATLLQHQAQAELGHYQDAAGPYPAWPGLADRTKRDREKRGLTPDDPLLATGELHDHIDMEVAERHAVVGVPHEQVGDGSRRNPSRDIGSVAISMELGVETETHSVPARSFLGRAGFHRGAEAAKAVGRAAADALAAMPHVPRKPTDTPF